MMIGREESDCSRSDSCQFWKVARSEISGGHMVWHQDLEGQSVSHAFRIRLQFRLTSDQSL
jgi:hypothetical protein